MQHIFTPYLPIRDTRIPVIGLISLCLTAVVMLFFTSSPLNANPWWGLLLGACLSALLLCLILSVSGLWKSNTGSEKGAKSRRSQEERKYDSFRNRNALTTVLHDLESLELRPVMEGGSINVSYHGGYFRIMPLSDHMLRIVYPCIYIVENERQDMLARIINRVNDLTPVIKLTSGHHTFEGKLAVNAVADMLYLPEDSTRTDTLCYMMESFFKAQHSLALGMAAAATEEPEPEISREIRDTLSHLSLN